MRFLTRAWKARVQNPRGASLLEASIFRPKAEKWPKTQFFGLENRARSAMQGRPGSYTPKSPIFEPYIPILQGKIENWSPRAVSDGESKVRHPCTFLTLAKKVQKTPSFFKHAKVFLKRGIARTKSERFQTHEQCWLSTLLGGLQKFFGKSQKSAFLHFFGPKNFWAPQRPKPLPKSLKIFKFLKNLKIFKTLAATAIAVAGQIFKIFLKKKV